MGDDFPIILRFSQWKQQDFSVKLAHTPAELEGFLGPLTDAGVDIFHCSTRRFWEPEFDGSDMNLAGWTKTITGIPTITVGSVSLNVDFINAYRGEGSAADASHMDTLLEMLERGDFDLVAVGPRPDRQRRLAKENPRRSVRTAGAVEAGGAGHAHLAFPLSPSGERAGVRGPPRRCSQLCVSFLALLDR